MERQIHSPETYGPPSVTGVTDLRPIASAADATAVEGVPGALLASYLDPAELRVWQAFLTRHALVARRLEADLVTRSDLPLAEYDVLFQLSLSEGLRLRMNELADRVLLSRAGITRLVDRLSADGLVARVKCASDARGYFALLTAGGLARLQDAAPGHMAAVRRFFLESFTAPELETLAELLERSQPLD
ncbi:MAG: MarR family transcriptional regulator [Candidatus Limnocylindrales bacterium]